MPPSPPCWSQQRRWLQLPVAIGSLSWVWKQNYISCPPLHFALPLTYTWPCHCFPGPKPGSDLHSLLWQHTVNPMMLCSYFVWPVPGMPVIRASIQKDSVSYSAKHCRKGVSPGYKCPSISKVERNHLGREHMGLIPFGPCSYKRFWHITRPQKKQ